MAVIAVFFVQSYVSSIEEEQTKKFGTEILVMSAKRDIKEMETLNETMVEFKKLPKQFKEPAAISFETKDEDGKESKQLIQSLKGITGYVAMLNIKKGEQITMTKLVEPSIRTGLSPQIAPGRRAIAISVGDMTGVAKLVKPGDRVDLIAIINPGQGGEKISKMILQDAVVLATGKSVSNNAPRTVEADPFTGKDKVRSLAEDTNFSTVTLEVEPALVQTVALLAANSENVLMLSLRNNDDNDRVNSGGVTVSDILGADAARVQRYPAGGRR
jgi:pilus assembly protein CpaB